MSANISREDILRELELLPVWRPRELLPNVNASNQLLADKAESVPAAIPETLAVPNSMQTIEPDELPAEITLPVMDDAVEVLGRAEIIQNMDWPTLQDCIKDCQACDLAAT